jgi:carbon-monoxide dehydrogenase large subunit
MLAHVLRMSARQIRVTAPDVGGGFGTKQDVYPEEMLVAFMARKLGRPVKWVATRREDLQASAHAREQVHDVELGLDRQGHILALRDRFVADIGALHAMSIGPQQLAAATLTGPYRVPVCEVSVKCVVTNKTPSGAYRGYGQPKSTFVVERALDLAASELGIDPAEIRFRNFIGPHEFPYRTALGLVYDSGDYSACLRQGLETIRYADFRRRQIAARQRGQYLGMGISFYVESAGFGPSGQVRARGCIYDGSETAHLRLRPEGVVEVSTGLSPHGQGAGTVLAQICAAELGLPLQSVNVIHGDTATSPPGWGTFGSRDAAVGGVAVLLAARQLKQKLLLRAAKALRASANRLTLRDGAIVDRRSGRKLAMAILLRRLPRGQTLAATATYDPLGFTFSYGVHLAVTEVDAATGRISIPRFVVVHDCGRMLNPLLVEGQIHGGVAQGLGSALYERIHYDAEAHLLTQTLTEYAVPPATEIPPIEVGHQETPTPLNPLGAKGMAEGGAIAPPAAVANAVADALGGTTQNLTELPLSMAAVRELTASLGLSRS